MKKQITCPECKGNGNIILTRKHNDYCGIGAETCTRCKGTGRLEVPTTNADRIRSMTDEELAEYLVYHNPYSTESNCLRWLQQPAEVE